MTYQIRPQGFVGPLWDILSACCSYYMVDPFEVISKQRLSRTVTDARRTAMYLIRQETGMSYPRMGQLFMRDHSTVIVACQTVDLAAAHAVRARMTGESLGSSGARELDLAPPPRVAVPEARRVRDLRREREAGSRHGAADPGRNPDAAPLHPVPHDRPRRLGRDGLRLYPRA